MGDEEIKATPENEFLGFYENAMHAQKQVIEEAWIVWEKKPMQEAYKNGFKDFLLEYIEKEIDEEYKKAGVERQK